MKTKLDVLRGVLESREQMHQQLKDRLAESERVYEQLLIQSMNHREAIQLTLLCLERQSDVKQYIESINTILFQTAFENDEQFVLEPIKNKEGTITGLEQCILRDGKLIPLADEGGGYQNIGALGYMISFVILNSGLDPVMLLDEPVVNLSKTRWTNLLKAIKEIQKIIPLQVGIISHTQMDDTDIQKIHVEQNNAGIAQVYST